MSTTLIMHLSTEEICRLSNISTDTVVKIVEFGIIKPEDDQIQSRLPEEWTFNPNVVSIAKKAVRLHNDLEIEWAGIALAIDLLEELEYLRNENQQLNQRLQRFLHD